MSYAIFATSILLAIVSNVLGAQVSHRMLFLSPFVTLLTELAYQISMLAILASRE